MKRLPRIEWAPLFRNDKTADNVGASTQGNRAANESSIKRATLKFYRNYETRQPFDCEASLGTHPFSKYETQPNRYVCLVSGVLYCVNGDPLVSINPPIDVSLTLIVDGS